MTSAGVDRRTGKPLTGWSHVVQSLEVILTTRIGARVMRRLFGSAVPGLIGRENVTPAAMLRFMTAYAIAVELWEPRFKLRKFVFPTASNSADRLRQGRLGFGVEGDYRPNALEGDYTVVIPKTVNM
ncbi:GPW/gp25 family protein [Methylosinus sp. PW1]|uniref:GPW/gp25 family protein n=1 Tax=Methylosinus sp. PW1 TaxID=107636 RepID=UPI00055E10C5|nr:GPW/gp25 family protein [Methylosinus sp. PW1]